ncbi:SDR family oxidoreductase [Micromonospora endophytica]|uniref:Uncharacterized protein n=1 Tax=Micromonospora endophytica TaxID=515350 RepID=A0A2W2DNC5_9ACTN|nr:SDR family NAD(P)-dependent oxidoreductase [Micromonospora endophytica]PZF98656.1 hypothetical protein C1I93_08220 [Micromonospora endophytica]RIW45199.1 SDR family NAD(P)-dependent oxidoreductase [Micromonospora endophytica]BCJ59597.1 hypothetical protein Jiend_30190 [Micromonospora endophytica]
MPTQRIALVTGANQGIGRQVARELTAHGVTVFVGSRDLARGEKAAAEIGGGATALHLDVTDPASIASAAERIDAEAGRLDLLINNAGISTTRTDLTVAEFRANAKPSSRHGLRRHRHPVAAMVGRVARGWGITSSPLAPQPLVGGRAAAASPLSGSPSSMEATCERNQQACHSSLSSCARR